MQNPHSKACLFRYSHQWPFLPRSSSAPHGGIIKAPSADIQVHWARHLDEVRQAPKAAFEVFLWTEMGAQLSTTTVQGMTLICLMAGCEHLLVLDEANDGGRPTVLTPLGAQRG